jgi:hypothetical protein
VFRVELVKVWTHRYATRKTISVWWLVLDGVDTRLWLQQQRQRQTLEAGVQGVWRWVWW